MKRYLIEHDSVIKILDALEMIPHKYVKNIIPYFEKSLKLIKKTEEVNDEVSEKKEE